MPKLLVLFCLEDEVIQALLENIWPLARRINVGNANAQVSIGECLKIPPGVLVYLECL